MLLSRDLREFIELLTANGVEFLVVGGFAVAWHGHPRFTADIDFLIRPNPANLRLDDPRSRSLASAAKHHATQFISQSPRLLGVRSSPKAFSQFEELLLLSALRFHAILNQLDKHPVRAESACFRHGANPRRYGGGKADALTDGFVGRPHCTIMHQNAVVPDDGSWNQLIEWLKRVETLRSTYGDPRP